MIRQVTFGFLISMMSSCLLVSVLSTAYLLWSVGIRADDDDDDDDEIAYFTVR